MYSVGEKINGVSIFDLVQLPFHHVRDVENTESYLSLLQRLGLTHLIVNKTLLKLQTKKELLNSKYPTMWFYIGNDLSNWAKMLGYKLLSLISMHGDSTYDLVKGVFSFDNSPTMSEISNLEFAVINLANSGTSTKTTHLYFSAKYACTRLWL